MNNFLVSPSIEKQIINHMQVEKFAAKGLLLLSPRVFPDPRGFFL
jgi:dTDP-4-dehydrorhamnose 3,5-epimerase-like enzyme